MVLHTKVNKGESEMLKNQYFGVEVEFTGISRQDAAKVIAQHFGTIASAPAYDGYKTITIPDSYGRNWKVMRDASICPQPAVDSYKCELVTPKLKYEDIETLQEIIRKLRQAGAKSNSSCGVHVHVDASNHDETSLRKLIYYMREKQDLIYDALAVSPERAARWCKKLDADFLADIKKIGIKEAKLDDIEKAWYKKDPYKSNHYNQTRYHGLNLHNVWYRGTVEFRLFNGTMHAGEIRAYVCLCLAISARALQKTGTMIYAKKYDGIECKKHFDNHMKNVLGLNGKEFENVRMHLTKHLS